MENNALHAIYRILVVTRHISVKGCESKKMVAILDTTEYLVMLIINKKDLEKRFGEALKGLGEKYPEFRGIFLDFEKDQPPVDLGR